jgi:hypothetical protein
MRRQTGESSRWGPGPMPTQSRRGLLAAFLLCLTLLTTGTAGAQDPPSWSLEPTNPGAGPGRNWFVLDVQPGQILRDSVTLRNPLERPLSFQLYAADAYNTPEGGAFTIREPEDPGEDITSWITLATDAYTVQPGEQITIPFEIRVPENAEPGDHVGGVAAKNVNPESTATSGGVTVDIKRVVGARVYARVAGPLVPSLRVEAVRVSADAPLLPTGGGRGDVTYTVTNTGNVRLSPTAAVKVTGGFGQELFASAGTQLQELLPGSSQTVTEPFDELPIVGPVYAEVEVEAPDVKASAQATMWVIPWMLIAVIVIVIIAAWWWLHRRHGARARSRSAPERDQADELVPQSTP